MGKKLERPSRRPVVEVDEKKLERAVKSGDLSEVRKDLERQTIEADRVDAPVEDDWSGSDWSGL